LLLCGCDGGGNLSAEDVLNLTKFITGSVLVVPIERSFDLDYGFGMYTTILFSRSNAERNRLFLEALSKEVPQVGPDTLNPSERLKRNAFFLPTAFEYSLQCTMGLPNTEHLFQILSSNPETRIDYYELIYGYDLSDLWLNSLYDRGVRYRDGPVLVTAPKPFGKLANGNTLVVVTDLSGKSPILFGKYIDLMLGEITKPETWTKGQIDDLSLRMADHAASFDSTIKGAIQAVGNFIRVIRAAQAGQVPEPKKKGSTLITDNACARLRAQMTHK
jgi:hypothetical protein